MPICPKCSATIHAGAEDQCPACGYDISQADEIFGYGQVEFTRVVDAAGALTHQERQELMRTLERLERRIRPVALCIYITDVGQVQELRTHAHWILNHARIHHPSFGKRELHKAIEDAELRERRPGEHRQQEEPRQGWFSRAWQAVRDYVMDALHPLPPPVKQEWMLILVMDVQLEMACFSWGYKLDPFIDPDSINTCIKCAKLQFRERAMVAGLKRVMRAAARRLSTRARAVNRRLRQAQKALALSAALGMLLSTHTLAEEAAPTHPQVVQTTTADSELPHWRADDYRHLMAGELVTGYVSLFPAKPTPEEIKAEAARRKELQRQQRELRRQRARQTPRPRPIEKREESDTRILSDYVKTYSKPPHGTILNDPQQLFSTVERDDVEHVLRNLNANARFKIYTTIFKGSQEITSEFPIGSLIDGVTQAYEYAVLLRFPIGRPEAIELEYKEINPTDDQRHAWLQKVRAAAADGSAEGLMNALHCLSSLITPLSADFKPIASRSADNIRLIEIDFAETQKAKKRSVKDHIRELIENPVLVAAVVYPLGFLLGLLGLYLLFNWLRTSSRLEDSEADLRLSSPYGAGVSRYVRYLEGTEAGKEKRLF